MPRQREELSATAKKRTYVWPTASLCGDVLEECLAALMTRFRESKVWR